MQVPFVLSHMWKEERPGEAQTTQSPDFRMKQEDSEKENYTDSNSHVLLELELPGTHTHAHTHTLTCSGALS